MTPQRRHDLTDEQWQRLAPLLPPQRPRTARPANDHRTVLNGILWVLRTGAPWRDLRNWLQAHDIAAVIPYREDESGDHAYDRELYRERPMIERTINRLTRYRRIATRDEKLASS